MEGELVSILRDSTPRILLASSRCAPLARRLQSAAPSVARIMVLEDIGTVERRSASSPLLSPWRRPHPEAVAAIVYTSGTTGSPKGVMISYASLVFETLTLEDVIAVGPGDSLLSILPLHHLLELTGGFLGVLNRGGTVCYSQSLFPDDILRACVERRIKAMIGVPLFFRALMRGLEREMQAARGTSRFMLRGAWLLAGLVRSRRVRRFLFLPLHRRLGGRLLVFISGGAPLDTDVARFFDRLGLPILEGYGLTEASPVVAVNTLRRRRLGSVGRPLPGVEVRIAGSDGVGDGEILVRGPNVMTGYYGREDLTREAIDGDGWLHTGDLGILDAEGFLHLTGRLRNLIVLGSGQKVQPEEVEAVLQRSPSLREACVLGVRSHARRGAEGEEVWAVIVPADAGSPAAGARKDGRAAVDTWMEEEVARIASNLAPFKRPVRVVVHKDELPKTASGKLKRAAIRQWVAGAAVPGAED
jgi:long-chain acyl-CoA synthetase